MAVDVNSPLVGQNLPSYEPWTGYYSGYVNHTCAVVEAFKNYNNTALFFSGNEVMNDVATGADVPAYLRAITRDLRNYIAKHVSRPIPVGYSAADVASILVDSFNYLTCAIDGAADDMTRSQLFALNSYSWCGDSTYTQSGYNTLVADFANTTVPVFFSEYGCNAVLPRVFTEVQALYGPEMEVLAGGIVYEYVEDVNNYGLVNLSSDGTAQLRQDFENLKAQYAKLNFTTLENAPPAVNPSAELLTCAPGLITTAGFESTFTIPAPPPGVDAIIANGVSPAPSGKFVTISNWKVLDTVLNLDGTPITGLSVKPISGADVPGTNTETSEAVNSTASANSTTSSGSGSTSLASRGLPPNGGTALFISLMGAAIAAFLF